MKQFYHPDIMSSAQLMSLRSRDESTKVGAIVASQHGDILSYGINRFPRRVRDDIMERHQRPAKYDWTVHAEMSAIGYAIRTNIFVAHQIMYSTQIPCPTCMGVIIECGMFGVFCPNVDIKMMKQKWVDSSSISIQMALEAGLHLEFV